MPDTEDNESSGLWGLLVLSLVAGGLVVARRISKEDLQIEAALWRERTQRREVVRKDLQERDLVKTLKEAETRYKEARDKLEQWREQQKLAKLAEKYPYLPPEEHRRMAGERAA